METPAGGRPSSREARELLTQLTKDEEAVRYPPIPRWFFAVQAAAVAAISLAQLLPPAAGTSVLVAVALLSGALAHRYWFNTSGVSGASVSVSDMGPFLGVVLGALVVGWTVDETTGARWIWLVTAVLTATAVLVTGHRYGREFGHAR